MSKAGMKLMTPGQISRMPKNDCILFLKGERPIYDKKNWPFNAEVNEEEEEKETDQQPDMLQDREQWDLSGDIIDCFQRYSSELSPEEQEEIIKGIEEGLTDQDVKRYFTLVGAEKMRQYRRVLIARKKKG